MRRSGFTLIEILVVVAIVATMVTVGLAGLRAGQGAARIRGAARDIFATIRHARSVALVAQQPSIITYYTDRDGDEPCARVEIVTAKLMEDTGPVKAQTLAGEAVTVGGDGEPEPAPAATEGAGEAVAAAAQPAGGGQSVADVLFAPISTEVVRGVRILVKKEGEQLSGTRTEAQVKSKISVFSNVDYLLGRYNQKKAEEEKAKAAEAEVPLSAAATEDQPRVSIVWEANGRTEPHRVYVFRDGTDPEKGLCIRIDRFGAAKIFGEGEEDE